MKVTKSTVPFVTVSLFSNPKDIPGWGNLDLILDGEAAEAEIREKLDAKECINGLSGNLTVSITSLGPVELTSMFTLNFTFSHQTEETLIEDCKEILE